MALTLLYNPGEYFSAHHDLIFTVLDSVKANDETLYPNYKYVCDVYIGPAQVARLISVPKPDTKIGIFNVGNIIRNYLSTPLNPIPGSLQAQEIGERQFYVTAQLKFGEDYNFTTYTNILVDQERTYFNHYHKEAISAYADKVISARPYATKVYKNADHCFIPFMPSDDTNITVNIRSYSQAGALLNTLSQVITPDTGSSNVQQLFNVAPGLINSLSPGFINDSVSYFTVEFNTTNIVNDSIYRFNLFCEAIHEVFTLHFLNEFGGFESRDFSKVSRKQLDIERSDFGKLPYEVGADGIPRYSNDANVWNETRSVYAVQWKEKMTLNSDFITDDEYRWLYQLIVSPQVYIEIEGQFYPVVIAGNNYEFKKVVNDELTNLTVNIEFGNQFNAQYR